MLGLKELKKTIKITETTVKCPVKGCREKVARQREFFKREEKFKCSKHNIYVSPSTFEYQNELDNILWREKADLELFKRVKRAKRESRIARDNSEDAVTWNVFRFLEKSKLLSRFLAKLSKSSLENPEMIYWSYSQLENGVWSPLQDARREFETIRRRGSEPDIIVKGYDVLFFIEAKFTAGNNTVFQSKNPKVQKKYEMGGGGWYKKVFNSDFETVAIAEKKYELLRFWLIGTWIAKLLNLNFYLVNLVLSKKEKNIERVFKRHIKKNRHREFLRITWENIYKCILNSNLPGEDKDTIIRYFENKTIGYDTNAKIQKAFSMRHRKRILMERASEKEIPYSFLVDKNHLRSGGKNSG